MAHPLSKRGELTRATERRAYPVALQVKRAAAGAAGPATVEGYASVTEQGYEMYDWAGPYTEVVRQGAFARTLNSAPQVQLLLNHAGLPMAYTQAGTLQLAEDSTGLHMLAQVNPARSDIADMLTALDDGNVNEMSFAFRVTRQQWSPDFDQRDILELDIHRGDVSVVNFGANPATSVSAVRAADLDRLDEGAARTVLARLQQRLAPRRGGRVAADLRALGRRVESRALTPQESALLAGLLASLAAADAAIDPIVMALGGADCALDDAQLTLAALLGVPNPDLDAEDDDMAEGAMSMSSQGRDLSLARAQLAVLAR